MSKNWPTLYKRSATGAILEWEIAVKGNTIVTVWGQQGGKKQTTEDVVKEGKNAGRTNGTTPEQQSLNEAQSQWEKKQKAGNYNLSLDDAKQGEASEMVEGGVLPMLARKYSEDGDKMPFPCYVQAKLDGLRCIAVLDKAGRCTLWSRTRKPITSLPHIAKACEQQFQPGDIIDGEAFVQGPEFEKLISLIRPSEPKPASVKIQFWVYDKVDRDTFEVRTKKLQGLKLPLVSVETTLVADEAEMMVEFQRCLDLGFEGLMCRAPKSYYENKRSNGLMKVKSFLEQDWLITGVEEGRGKLVGCGIFVLRTKTGQEFRAKMMGATERLRDYWQNPKKYCGKLCTVKYQNLTSEGVPRFPVAIRVREDLL